MMNEPWLPILAVALFLLRPVWLWRFWQAPLKDGEGKFLGIDVEPGFYQNAGAILLRRYRVWLIAPIAMEALLQMWLLISHRWTLAIYEQIPAMVALIIWLNFTIYQFMARARLSAPAAPAQAAHSVQLSLDTRRLRDHSDWTVEALIFGLTAVALVWIAARWFGWFLEPPDAVTIKTAVFILYMQAGLLLVKGVFVRWRMRYPPRRVDDYRRWRSAWLTYHLRIFDALRLLFAFSLFGLLAFSALKSLWGREQVKTLGLPVAIITLAIYTIYCARERRRLEVVRREINPLELIKEYPPASFAPALEGRYLAGGLFYLNRDNPMIVTRSPQGLAINLANRRTYLWIAYLAGLVWLVIWQVNY